MRSTTTVTSPMHYPPTKVETTAPWTSDPLQIGLIWHMWVKTRWNLQPLRLFLSSTLSLEYLYPGLEIGPKYIYLSNFKWSYHCKWIVIWISPCLEQSPARIPALSIRPLLVVIQVCIFSLQGEEEDPSLQYIYWWFGWIFWNNVIGATE